MKPIETKWIYGIRWFEPRWSHMPRVKADFGKYLKIKFWPRIFVIIVLIAIPSAYEIQKAFPDLDFNWAKAITGSFVVFGAYMAFAYARLWLVPPRIGINYRGVSCQKHHRRRADIRSITVDTSDQARPLFKVETVNKPLEFGVSPKIVPQELTAFLKEMYSELIVVEKR